MKTHFLSNFLEYSYCEDVTDNVSRILAPISLIGALANPEGELVYGGMMVVSGVLYTLSLFIELACSFYYEGRI